MSKKKGKTPQPAVKTMTASAPKMEAFTFGEPVPVLDRRDILDYVECISNGRWYEPPISFTESGKKPRAAVHHSSRFTSNAIFWPRRFSRIRGFPSRISAALCWIFWCSVMRFWKSDTAPPVRSSDWKPHRQNIPPWCGGGCLLVGAVLQRADTFHARLRVSSAGAGSNQELYGLPEYLQRP